MAKERATPPEGPGSDVEARGEGEVDGGGGTAGLCVDEDGDGIPQGPGCEGSTDCDDGDANVGVFAERACSSSPDGTLLVGACQQGTQSCNGGTWTACTGEVVAADESCDGVDNDCDGQVDEALSVACYTGPSGTEGVGACSAGVRTCVNGSYGACVGQVLPGAERCDGIDNDCNGDADNELVRTCYPGPSGTSGTGVCSAGTETCVAGVWSACTGAVLPATETCDALDNDCNGATDENVVRLSFDGQNQQLEPVLKPVDIIFVIDNSNSMSDEISAVEANINVNFAGLMAQSGLDYRVIMLSDFGTTGGQVCVQSPLGGDGCVQSAACPTNTTTFFHYDVSIGSHDALYRILETYDAPDGCGKAPAGWSQWLRPDAARVFIVITDDGPFASTNLTPNTYTAQAFEAELFTLTPAMFGDATARNYVFHSIIGLAENAPVTDPWLPQDPLVYGVCSGNNVTGKQDGVEYQKLSRTTGGLRYPICQYQSFDAVFQTVAAGIVAGARLSCEFNVSAVPSGHTMDQTTLQYTASDGSGAIPLTHVANEAACTGNAFYVDGFTVKLCPDACTLWRDDPLATVDLLFTCQNQVQP